MRFLARMIALGGLLHATAVQAGPNEAPELFATNPAVPNLWVLKYQYSGGGMLVSKDAGETWGLICSNAYDGSPDHGNTYGLAVAGDGTIFTGEFSGLLQGREDGCAWTASAELPETWVPEIQPDPLDPNRVFAITSSNGEGDGIWAYEADAWTQFSPPDEIGSVASLAVVAMGESLRFYEVVSRYVDDSANVFIRYSDDDAQTWTEYPLVSEAKFPPRIVAVDPQQPDHVVLLERNGGGTEPDQVRISTAAGAPDSWRVLYDDEQYGGATYDDAGVLYLGLRSGSIAKLASVDAELETLEVTIAGRDMNAFVLSPQTLYFHPERGLLAALLEEFGSVDVATGEFVPMVSLRYMESFLECPGQDLGMACEVQLTRDGWCVASHFPDAPLCQVYNPSESTSGSAGTDSAGDAGAAGSDGSGAGGSAGMAATAGSDDGTAGSDTAAGSATAGMAATAGRVAASDGGTSTPTAVDSSDSGGCSCVVGKTGSTGGGAALYITVALGMLWYRRRSQDQWLR